MEKIKCSFCGKEKERREICNISAVLTTRYYCDAAGLSETNYNPEACAGLRICADCIRERELWRRPILSFPNVPELKYISDIMIDKENFANGREKKRRRDLIKEIIAGKATDD